MTIFQEKSKRRVVPRWRLSAQTAATLEFRPLKPRPLPMPAEDNDSFLAGQIAEFKETPNLGIAAESITAAMMVGKPGEAKESAEFILAHSEEAPAMLQQLAKSILAVGDADAAAAAAPVPGDRHDLHTARIRQLLETNPRSAALWVDYARMVASNAGTRRAKKKAKRAMETALALAPDSRWVLRAANRFFLHIGDAEFAHSLIARHPRTKGDPWLMAAEIASAQIAHRPPLMQKKALELLRSKAFHPIHLSELYTAAGTIILEDGAHKHARRLFERALEYSTENALAQTEWASRELGDGIMEVQPIVQRALDAHEATCWMRYSRGNIDGALRAARGWLADEPFATRPIGMVCHLAALNDDFPTLIRHARLGMATEPTEILHRNNLIFALIATGKIFENAEVMEDMVSFTRHRVLCGQSDLPHALANYAMFCYRAGHVDLGRQYYDGAYQFAMARNNYPTAAHVALYHAREAALQRADWAAGVLETAKRAARLSRKVIGGGIDAYIRKIEGVIADPVKREALIFREQGAPKRADLAAIVERNRQSIERHTLLFGVPRLARV